MPDSKSNINSEGFKVLQEGVDEGIISINQTAEKLNEMKRKRILQQHPYSIYYNESTGYWLTHVPNENRKEKRQKIKRKSREELEDLIVEFYTGEKKEAQKSYTIREIYPQWLEFVGRRDTASTTIRRYDCDWNRWLDKDPIVDRPIPLLDYHELDQWAHDMVKGNNIKNQPMTNKQYYNLISIVKGCLNYAIDKEIIKENPFNRIKINKKLFYVPEQQFNDDRDQVFSEEEFPEVQELALAEYYEKRDEVALAVYMISYTGMRSGEVCALKWNSLNKDMTEVRVAAQIVRDEKKGKDGKWKKTGWKLVNHTKTTNGNRILYIPEKLREVLKEHKRYKKPESEDEMIFTRADGTYITCNQTYRRTVKYSNKINTYRKGAHKLRKTYLSALYDGGVHESTLTKIAGHYVDGKTLHRHYLKDRKGQNEVRDNIEKILK